MVLVKLPKLHGQVSWLVARKPCVLKVIRGVHKEPHRRIRAGP